MTPTETVVFGTLTLLAVAFLTVGIPVALRRY